MVVLNRFCDWIAGGLSCLVNYKLLELQNET